MNKKRASLGTLLATVVILVVVHAPAWPIVLETKDGRVRGYLVKETATALTVRMRLPDGAETEKDFDLPSTRVLHRLDVRRLEGLKPENPRAYRDYAEDLEGWAEDPEAQETAIRLYVLAANLDPENLASPCLRALRNLPLSPMDRRKAVALSYLMDARKDRGVLEREAPADGKPRESSWRTFLGGLRQLRKGNTRAAISALRSPAAQPHFAAIPGLMPINDISALCLQHPSCPSTNRCIAGTMICTNCRGTGKVRQAGQQVSCPDCNGQGTKACPHCGKPFPGLSADQLQLIVSLELADEGDAPKDPKSPPDAGGQKWSTVMKISRPGPIHMPTLDTVTPYNPRQSVYRKGQWVEP